MPSSTTASAVWPEPGWLLLRIVVAFALAISLAWLGGRWLVEAMLPLAQTVLIWIDDRFAILYFGLDHTGQDTVIRLRVNLVRMIVVGSHVTEPHPKGWLEVTTTVGAMLQPLTIALGLVAAWPAKAATILLRLAFAVTLGLLFMAIDIPLTLHAYTWDMFLDRFDPEHISPLMLIHRFLHGGGRLGVGILLAASAAYGARGATLKIREWLSSSFHITKGI